MSDTLVQHKVRRLGRYEDLELLGQGGMGAVYRARDPSLDRVVAIKVITKASPEFIERFRREARAIARLSHPNVVQVFDFGDDESGDPYFVMELLPGRSLDKIIAERGGLPPALVADLLRQAAEGLAAAHAVDIVHRDVKPANLVVDSQFHLKLVDFGIAHVAMADGGEALTRPQALMGTPHYMAPEMLKGQKVDGRADIYALGLTGFHLLAGRPPYEAPSSIALSVKQLNEPLPDLAKAAPGTPRALCDLIEQMAKKDREERIQTCAEVATRLRAILAAPDPVPTPPDDRRWWRIGVVASALVLVVIAGVALMHKSARDGASTHDVTAPVAHRADPIPPAPLTRNIMGTPPTPPAPGPAVVASSLRVAVLKFKNLGGDHSLDVLTEGIGETALTQLAGIPHVMLVERNQVEQAVSEIDFGQTRYVDKKTAAALGSLSGVEVAVQGGYQKANGQVRVTVRFVRVATGEIVDTFDVTRPEKSLFDLQDAVAAILKKRLTALAASTAP